MSLNGSTPTADFDLPPGQHAVADFPTPAASPEPRTAPVAPESWELVVTTELGTTHRWGWDELHSLPSEQICVDLHCVEGWSVLASCWTATSVHHVFRGVRTSAEFVSVESYDASTVNLPLEDLLEMPTWIAYGKDGDEIPYRLGGPVRLLVPHLYLWKSAKSVHRITLTDKDQPGHLERNGFHNYGDPWRQQRHHGD